MTKRDYNVDLFRVIATLLVIILHVLGQGGVNQNVPHGSANYWVVTFLRVGSYCAVNCFGLITGYIMVNKSIKLKNIIGLWFQVVFYSILISALFFVFMPETITIRNVVVSFLPVLGEQWWYISSYFALFFCIPILNAAANYLPKITFQKVLLVIIVGICVFDCVFPTDAFKINGGYSPIWLMILYLVGAYIRKYDLKQKITALKSLLLYFAAIILTIISKVVIHFATKAILGQARFENHFISYISITIVLSSVFLFLFCLNFKIGNILAKLITFFAPATLGVFLIHAHPHVYRYILKDAFVSFVKMPTMLSFLSICGVTAVIFVICSLLDLLRIKIFKFVKIGKLSESIEGKITNIYSKIFKI